MQVENKSAHVVTLNCMIVDRDVRTMMFCLRADLHRSFESKRNDRMMLLCSGDHDVGNTNPNVIVVDFGSKELELSSSKMMNVVDKRIKISV